MLRIFHILIFYRMKFMLNRYFILIFLVNFIYFIHFMRLFDSFDFISYRLLIFGLASKAGNLPIWTSTCYAMTQ